MNRPMLPRTGMPDIWLRFLNDALIQHLRLNRGVVGLKEHTTTERNGIDAQNGDFIYNSTTGQVEVYFASAWWGLVVSDADGDVAITGDLTFVGSGTGLPHACIDGTDETVVCTLQNTWYQITFDVAGEQNLVEADIVNNELEVSLAGSYGVHVTACMHTNPANDFEIMIKKNDGATDLLHLFETTVAANRVESLSGFCIKRLSASDRLEAWVRCTSAAGQSAVFDHVGLNCFMLGG